MKFTAVPQQLATSCCAEVSLAGCSLVWYCQKRSILEGDSSIAKVAGRSRVQQTVPDPTTLATLKVVQELAIKKPKHPKSLQFQIRVSSPLHFCTSPCLHVCRCRCTHNMSVQFCTCIVDHICIIVYLYLYLYSFNIVCVPYCIHMMCTYYYIEWNNLMRHHGGSCHCTMNCTITRPVKAAVLPKSVCRPPEPPVDIC